jgi:hypothetical protein
MQPILVVLINYCTMENGITPGELALWGGGRNNNNECYHYHRGRGTATTAVALGASGLGIAIFGGLAIAYGLNAASKARARGNEAAILQSNKTVDLLASVVAREATRTDGVNIDVQQTLRSLTNATAQGGSASSNALATAEALALINNSSNPLSSVIQQNCALRVQRVSEQNCGCGCNG